MRVGCVNTNTCIHITCYTLGCSDEYCVQII